MTRTSDHVRNRCTGGARSVLRRTGQGPHRNAEGPERIDGDASPLARRNDGPACDLRIVELARDPEKINRSLRGLVEPAPINIENRQIGDRWGPDGRLSGYRNRNPAF